MEQMKTHLTIILIGLVSGFIGILPLFRKKADRYSLLVVFHDALCGLPFPFAVGGVVVERHGHFRSAGFAFGHHFMAGQFALCIAVIGVRRGGGCVYLCIGALPYLICTSICGKGMLRPSRAKVL